jgi:hypothetical protein
MKNVVKLILISALALVVVSCGNVNDSSDTEKETSSVSSISETDSSNESSETESFEVDSSETDSSEDESSKETPKKVEDSSSEDDNSSKVTTTKKTETPKTTKATQPVVTQAPVTQKPATTTKTTTKKTTTHTHRWVKQWDDGNGTIFYWCPDCFAEKYDHYTVTTTTTKTQPTSKTIKSNEWIPVYFKTVVANCVADGYDWKTGKHLYWLSPTYWDVKALSRGEAKALADYKKANDEASAWCYTVNCGGWTQGGNDHPINTPDKSSIAFWYYRDSNGKLAIQFPMSPNQRYSGIKTEADLKTYGCYDSVSLIGTPGLGYDTVYYTGTPWAK